MQTQPTMLELIYFVINTIVEREYSRRCRLYTSLHDKAIHCFKCQFL